MFICVHLWLIFSNSRFGTKAYHRLSSLWPTSAKKPFARPWLLKKGLFAARCNRLDSLLYRVRRRKRQVDVDDAAILAHANAIFHGEIRFFVHSKIRGRKTIRRKGRGERREAAKGIFLCALRVLCGVNSLL